MDGYVSKPFQQSDITAALQGMREVDESMSGKSPADDSDSSVSAVDQRKSSAVVDWNVALESAEGDVHLLRRLADIAVRETDDQLSLLINAFDKQEYPEIERCAQNLKNHFRIFDAAVADHLAFHIEIAASEGNNDIDEQITKLEQQTHQLQAELIDFIEGRIQIPRK